ncbi:MAG TPA: hypothetical protein VF131_01815 [Blastocatellia bacterium]|nr:hypothetical protein [Blastocatellia bacterium]
MKRAFCFKMIARCVAVCLLINAANAFAPESVFSSGTRSVTLSSDHIVSAHGGAQVLASVRTAEFEFVRITPTRGPDSFEHKVVVSTSGSMFRRYAVGAEGSDRRIEVFDGNAAFSGSPESSGGQQWQPMDENRLRAVKFIIVTCNLLHFLQQLVNRTAEVLFQEATQGGLYRFDVRTGNWNGALYTDRTGLIKQIEIGERVFQFAAYRQVEGVRLPLVVRVFYKRVVFEMFFVRISLNPDFPPFRFSPVLGDDE